MNSLRNKKKFDINDIIRILPHRYPFILIDKIQINEPGQSLTAIKNTTINEPYFQGHFPGQPVMPGVLSLEMMAQAGSFLMLNQVDDPLTKNMFFTTVEKARFKKPITPGDQLNINVELIHGDLWVLLGHLGHALVPIGHGDGDTVGLSGRGELFARAGLR